MIYLIIYLNDNRWAIGTHRVEVSGRRAAEKVASDTHPMGPSGLYRLELIDVR